MSVKTNANGRRSVELNIDVTGVPEQEWEAIAFTPGDWGGRVPVASEVSS